MEHLYSAFSDIDIRFARLMVDLAKVAQSHSLFLVSCLVCHFTLEKRNSCIDLNSLAGRTLHEILALPKAESPELNDIRIADIETLTGQLRSVSPVGKPGEYAPLVLDNQNRFYLFRYWEYEQKLVEEVAARIGKTERQQTSVPTELLDRFFPAPKTDPDWQRMAAIKAIKNRLTVISGGPGTGKTHTVTAILALLLTVNPELSISLCAPTGKAAARLQDSIHNAKKQQAFLNPDLLDRFPETAGTIHRLLGVRKGSAGFRHNQKNPVVTDVVVVDEASMVSLALMSKLMQAVSRQTRLILLGDKNQLSSVEAGAVFGDICEAGAQSVKLAEAIVELKYSYRFEHSGGIGELSRHVNEAGVEEVLDLIKSNKHKAISCTDLPKPSQLQGRLNKIFLEKIQQIINSKSLEDGYAALENFKVLCAHRTGEYGVEKVNHLVEQALLKQGVISSRQTYYKGKPIIIKQNDYNVNLYNGDTGIIWPDNDGHLRAFFPGSKHGFTDVSLSRLPRHQAAYALTIHESQGSEFTDILIILGESATPLLSRELLYTAITRAKHSLEIWANEEILKVAINNKAQRQSGLKKKLMIQSACNNADH